MDLGRALAQFAVVIDEGHSNILAGEVAQLRQRRVEGEAAVADGTKEAGEGVLIHRPAPFIEEKVKSGR